MLRQITFALPGIAAFIAIPLWGRFAEQRHELWPDREVAWALWHWFSGARATWQWPPLETGRSDLKGELPRRAVTGAARTAGTVTLVYLWSGKTGDPLFWGVTLTAGWAGIAILATHVAIRRAMRGWWVFPLEEALYETSGWKSVFSDDEASRAQVVRGRRWVKVRRLRLRWRKRKTQRLPRPWLDTRLFFKVELPYRFDNSDLNRKNFLNQATHKLDLGEIVPGWHTTGHFSLVRLYPELRLPPPPKWHDKHVRQIMRPALGPMIWPHGLGKGGVAITRSRKTDNPHLMISAGTIGGKSTALRWYAANVLHFGGLVVICDIKRHSHIWARGLPGTLSFPDVTLPEDAPGAGAQINEALLGVWAEIERRNRECDPLRVGDPWPEFQPVLLVFDELNTTTTAMNRWWKTARPNTRAGDLAPGTHALQDILHQGRAVCVSAAFGAQAARRRAVGGGEGFEDIGNILMVPPYSKATWNVCAPHIEYIPAKSHHDHPAWGILLDGLDAIEVQRIEMTEREAVRFSRAGDARRAAWQETPAIAGLRALGAGQPRPPEPTMRVEVAIGAAHGNGNKPDPGTSGPPDDFDAATLRQFSSDEGAGTVPMRYDALRKAADKPGFPGPARKGPIKADGTEMVSKRLYLRQEIEVWFEERSNLGDPGVYVIEPPHDLKVKIGETKRLEDRIDEFSWSGVGDQIVKQWFPCTDKQHAQDLETWLHAKYDSQRIPRTEWFRKEGQLDEDYLDADRLLAGCPDELRPVKEAA